MLRCVKMPAAVRNKLWTGQAGCFGVRRGCCEWDSHSHQTQTRACRVARHCAARVQTFPSGAQHSAPQIFFVFSRRLTSRSGNFLKQKGRHEKSPVWILNLPWIFFDWGWSPCQPRHSTLYFDISGGWLTWRRGTPLKTRPGDIVEDNAGGHRYWQGSHAMRSAADRENQAELGGRHCPEGSESPPTHPLFSWQITPQITSDHFASLLPGLLDTGLLNPTYISFFSRFPSLTQCRVFNFRPYYISINSWKY